MPEHVDKLSSLVKKKYQHLSLTAVNYARHMWIKVYFLVFESAAFFFVIDNHFQMKQNMVVFMKSQTRLFISRVCKLFCVLYST